MPRALTSLALACSLAGAALCSHAADNTGLPAEVGSGTIDLAATLNEMALACGDLTPAAVDAKRKAQRAAALKDQGMQGADYDRIYAQSVKQFQQRWSHGTPEQKKQGCARMKSLAK